MNKHDTPKNISFKKSARSIKRARDKHLSFLVIKKDEFFRIPGIYYLKKNGVVVYIGESNCVISRLASHSMSKEKDFDEFLIAPFEGTQKERRKREAQLIGKNKPLYNKVCYDKDRTDSRKRIYPNNLFLEKKSENEGITPGDK